MGWKGFSPLLQRKAPIGRRWRHWPRSGKSSASYPADPGPARPRPLSRYLRCSWSRQKVDPARIALAAPTGKSAARLKESIGTMSETLGSADAIKEHIPHEVSTIHRLLGPIAGSVRFRYSDKNPLPYDVVIVDEASMVALPLMAKLAAALKPDARLILLGDRDQLASVEAGAALGDMCGAGQQEVFSTEFSDLFFELTGDRIPPAPPDELLPPLADSLVVLKKNYRFPADSGIGAAGRAVNAGNGEDAIAILKGDQRRYCLARCTKTRGYQKGADRCRHRRVRQVSRGRDGCGSAWAF